MGVRGDGFHDGGPVEVERALGVGNIDGVEPLFYRFERFYGDGIDVGRGPMEVLEDEDHVEVLEAELYALEVGDFDVFEGNDGEGGFGELDQAVGGGLHEDV